MKEKSIQEQLFEHKEQIVEQIEHWKDINKNGCNDPAWTDGCNMNLVRNHIIYHKGAIHSLCDENNIPLPEEYYLSTPPEVENNYMANRKQKARVKRLEAYGRRLMTEKYEYDEQQISLF